MEVKRKIKEEAEVCQEKISKYKEMKVRQKVNEQLLKEGKVREPLQTQKLEFERVLYLSP